MFYKFNTLSRREFVAYSSALAGFGAALSAIPGLAQVLSGEATVSSLQADAAKKGLIYGSAGAQQALFNDPHYAAAFAEQCAILVPEFELQWESVRPTPDTYDFTRADWLYNFSQQHKMKFCGHSFIWHEMLPQWFSSYATPNNAVKLLTDHIATVGGRYAGKMYSWVVINEVIAQPGEKDSNGLRDTPWLQLMGPSHIEIAFRAAAKADPSALLIWNEHSLEDEMPNADQKRAWFMAQLKDHLSRGVPIHAVGIQSHLWAEDTGVGGEKLKQFLKDISALGLKIIITELDVMDSHLTPDITQRDTLVAEQYTRYLTTVLQEKAVTAVLSWGLSDTYSWYKYFMPRADGLGVRPLPLDADMKRKPAWYAMAKAFDDAPSRDAV